MLTTQGAAWLQLKTTAELREERNITQVSALATLSYICTRWGMVILY